MADVNQVWKETLPTVRQGVTGVGVWTALSAAVPIALEDGVLVLGIPPLESELGGHLRIAATKRLIETTAAGIVGTPLTLRVIEGTTQEDFERAKRRDAERRKLQEAELTKMRAEMQARTSWDAVYEQLSRRYAAISSKSLPQNRARFFEEAVALIAEARQSQTNWDELGERNYARCLERLSQYSDVPSTLCAIEVMKRAGEL